MYSETDVLWTYVDEEGNESEVWDTQHVPLLVPFGPEYAALPKLLASTPYTNVLLVRNIGGHGYEKDLEKGIHVWNRLLYDVSCFSL